MKNLLFILFFPILISCNKEVSCSGNDEKKVFYDLLSSEFQTSYSKLKEKNDLNVVFDIEYEIIKNDFFTEVIKLEGMRPTKVEKELKKCECEAKITMQFPKEITDYLETNLTKFYNFDLELLKKPENIENIKYSLQLTEDNQVYCETLDKNVLNEFFISYSYYKNIINNHKRGLLKANLIETKDSANYKMTSKLDSLLIKQLKNPEIVQNSEICDNEKICNLTYEWSKLYYSLPLKFQKNVETNSGVFPVAINDFHGLWKGFYYISKNENMNKVSEMITDKIEYKNEPVTFRASMVYFYVKYQILQEKDEF